MARRTLIDFFVDLSAIDGEFIVFDDGYRSWSYTYGEIAAAARAFAGRLREARITSGQAVAIWAENRAEWIVALWGCVLEGVVLVPIDYRASADLLQRIVSIVDARAILVGDAAEGAALPSGPPVWKLSEIRGLGDRRSALGRSGIGARGSGLGARQRTPTAQRRTPTAQR